MSNEVNISEESATWVVIQGKPELFFEGHILPKVGQRVEMVCTLVSAGEVQMQLRVISE